MNRRLIETYSMLVDFLGATLGPCYEIVLHDYGSKGLTMVALANGDVSGRHLGDPPSTFIHRFIANKIYKRQSSIVNYRNQLDSGKILRSSTFFLLDHNDELQGVLCINFDDSQFFELWHHFLDLLHPQQFTEQYFTEQLPVNFSTLRHQAGAASTALKTLPRTPGSGGAADSSSPADSNDAEEDKVPQRYFSRSEAILQERFTAVRQAAELPDARLTQEEKMRFVQLLSESGFFQLKSAVQYAADGLSCSSATVYRYLSMLNRRRQKEGSTRLPAKKRRSVKPQSE